MQININFSFNLESVDQYHVRHLTVKEKLNYANYCHKINYNISGFLNLSIIDLELDNSFWGGGGMLSCAL